MRERIRFERELVDLGRYEYDQTQPTVPAAGALMEPYPTPAIYADIARDILKKHTKKSNGIVLSVVDVAPADGNAMIDVQTEPGPRRPVLKNPPARVVMPPEVYSIEWKAKGWKRSLKFEFVWLLSNEKATFPVGGVLFLPMGFGEPGSFVLVTINVGALEGGICTNVHHAEMQATGRSPARNGFVEGQPAGWRARIGSLHILNLSRKRGLGYSPCNACCEDLAGFLTDLKALQGNRIALRASITWLTLYNKNKPCGHPTNAENLRKLANSGWVLIGPGWSIGGALERLFVPGAPIAIKAPPNDIYGRARVAAVAGKDAASVLKTLQKWADAYRHAFAKAFADTILTLSRDNWQTRLAGLTSVSVETYRDLPLASAATSEWERWIPSKRDLRVSAVKLSDDDFVARFRWHELMIVFAIIAFVRRRIAQADADQVKGVALKQVSAAGIAAAVQYVNRRVQPGHFDFIDSRGIPQKTIGVTSWDKIAGMIRSSQLTEIDISKRLEPLGMEQIPPLPKTP